MQTILWLARKSIINTFLKEKRWIVYFGLPLVGVLLSMVLYSNSSGMALRVGIVNGDGNQAITQDAIRFVEGLNQVEVTLTDDSALRADIAAGKLDSGLVFAEGFADSLRNGQPAALDLVSVKGAQVTAYVKAMLEGYLGNVTAIGKETEGDPAAFDSLYAEYAKQSYKITAETVKDTSKMKDMTYQSIGFLITFMLFSAINMSELILKEKENRTFLRILSSPVSARAYVVSNVLVSFIVLFLQIIVTLFLMRSVFHVDSGIPYGQMIAILLLFSLASIGLSLMIVAIARSSQAAGGLSNLIITPTCLLSGCFFPMDIMPDAVRKISNFFPQHWLLDSINKLQRGDGFGSIGLNLAILFAFAAAFAIIAIYRFSRNNDTRLFV
ncbi:ABC transporter permease [Cohnella lupini]|uniref:Transport permease protein n=1 Tax=Cohnella lupini TaxID=1294267 RepID=A0A3D9HZR9_9BACL|nr:ABC transporter permease [Cohnella lupini]RED54963.1 ABC-2 type transport system permease protein [Cohnella lupini]